MNNKILVALATVIGFTLIGLAITAGYLYANKESVPPLIETHQDNNDKDEIPDAVNEDSSSDDQDIVESRYGQYLVYGLSVEDEDMQKAQNHCQSAGGTFNECGSPCGPPEEGNECIAVCALVCILPDDAQSSYETYTNDLYQFSLEKPQDWEVTVTDEPYPVINIYPPFESITDDLPFSIHTNQTQVSIYPEGLPTEGILSQQDLVDITLQEPLWGQASRRLLLSSGDTFAYVLYFTGTPDSWSQSGFVYGRAQISEYSSNCYRNGVEVTDNSCSPLESNDEIHLSGGVSASEMTEIKKMLSTLYFID